jgi:hypothetical protein
MKNCLSFLFSLSVLLAFSVLAAEKSQLVNAPLTAKSVAKTTPIVVKPDPKNSLTHNDKITLYNAPTISAQPIEQLLPQTKLIEIYRENNWVKVGDPMNGNVGWITDIAYQTIQASATKSHANEVQTVFLQVNPASNNFPENIVAYKNGQKLSEADAKKLYAQLNQQQAQFNQQMMQFQNSMNHIMTQFNNSAMALSLIPIMPSVVFFSNKQ